MSLLNYQAGVIYKIGCNNCDAVYIGETGRLLKDRRDEHRKDVVKSKVIFMYCLLGIPLTSMTRVSLVNLITSE